jgi:hypothetical protein
VIAIEAWPIIIGLKSRTALKYGLSQSPKRSNTLGLQHHGVIEKSLWIVR